MSQAEKFGLPVSFLLALDTLEKNIKGVDGVLATVGLVSGAGLVCAGKDFASMFKP